MLDILAATLDFNVGSIREIFLIDLDGLSFVRIRQNTRALIELSRNEWDADEVSWGFQRPPILAPKSLGRRLAEAVENCIRTFEEASQAKSDSEEDNEKILLNAYGLYIEPKDADSASVRVSSRTLIGSLVGSLLS